MSVGVKIECQTLSITIGAHSSKYIAIAGYGAERNLAADGGGIGGNGAIAIDCRVLRRLCTTRFGGTKPNIRLSVSVARHSLVGKDQI